MTPMPKLAALKIEEPLHRRMKQDAARQGIALKDLAGDLIRLGYQARRQTGRKEAR